MSCHVLTCPAVCYRVSRVCSSFIRDCGCPQPGDKLESIVESINERMETMASSLPSADRGGGGALDARGKSGFGGSTAGGENSEGSVKKKRKKREKVRQLSGWFT